MKTTAARSLQRHAQWLNLRYTSLLLLVLRLHLLQDARAFLMGVQCSLHDKHQLHAAFEHS